MLENHKINVFEPTQDMPIIQFCSPKFQIGALCLCIMPISWLEILANIGKEIKKQMTKQVITLIM